ncbi:hypothetical protein TRIUR3_30067 [Triticum urartu]|uniref:Uncharacterized protein n=1 Tax=Triticum urartu TaxID=4572 RepID=M7YTW6_TRIUA|nr:hypothetical protein TRIUR3_30067 [Triticum urartu]
MSKTIFLFLRIEITGWIPLDFNNLNSGVLNLSCNNLTGKRVGYGDCGTSREWSLRICDPAVYLPDVISVFELGEICTREDPRARPDINMVLFKLTLLFRTSAEAGDT